MNSVDYYQNQFGLDLIFTSENGIYGHPGRPYHPLEPKRISIYDLDPRRVLGDEPLNKTPFRNIKNKHLFLMSFYYSALLDQSVHYSVNEEHLCFDKMAQYPKFVGILSGGRSNTHPTILLGLASVYAEYFGVDQANNDFKELTDFIIPDMSFFFRKTYPEMTKRLQANSEKITLKLFSTFLHESQTLQTAQITELKEYPKNQTMINEWLCHLRQLLRKEINILNT